MGRKIWNVVLVPEGGGAVRNLRVPARLLYAAGTGMTIGLFVVIGSVGLHLWSMHGLRKAEALRKENASLRNHLVTVNGALEQVEAMVREGEQMERQARLLAGLDPFEGDAPPSGLGGPLLGAPRAGSALPGSALSGTALPGSAPGGSGADAAPAGSFPVEADDPAIAITLQEQDQRLDALAQKVSYQRNSFKETLESLRDLGDRLAHTPSVCPLRNGFAVSSGFGWRTDPFTSERAFHSGLDLRADSGTPIYSPADGEVVFSGWDGEFGLCVRVKHGYGLDTGYFHLSKTEVRQGDRLRRGEPLGEVGSSGRSTAPHLHYEVYVNGVARDPSPYILTPRAFAE